MTDSNKTSYTNIKDRKFSVDKDSNTGLTPLEKGLQEFLRSGGDVYDFEKDFRKGCEVALCDQKQKIREWYKRDLPNLLKSAYFQSDIPKILKNRLKEFDRLEL